MKSPGHSGAFLPSLRTGKIGVAYGVGVERLKSSRLFVAVQI
jgi:hypothetical protein